MATGGVFLTEDDLSCEICFNLFTDPKALKCLHTFCGGCITQLAGHRRMVECPNCREKTHMADLRKDFKTQKLLDKHLGQVGGTSAPAGDACEMCKKKGKSIQMYCTDCDKLLCTMCCRIHADIKDIAHHATMLKPELTKNYRSKLQTKLDLLQTQEKRVSIKINNLDSDISRLQQEQGKLMKTVYKEIDEAIHELNKTRLELQKKIVDSDINMMENLMISKAKCMKEKTCICSNITQIRGVMNKDDAFMLKNSLITKKPSIPLPAIIRINFVKFPSVKVVTGSWRPHDIVNVVPFNDNEIAGGSAVRNKDPFNDHEIAVGSAVRNKVPFNDHEIAVGSAVRNKVPFNDNEIAVSSAVRNKVPFNDHEIAGGSAVRNKVPFNDHEIAVGSAVRHKVPFNDHEIAGGSAVRNKVPFNDHEIAVGSAVNDNEIAVGSAVRNKVPFNDNEIAVGSAVRNKVPFNDNEIAVGSAVSNKVPFNDHEIAGGSAVRNKVPFNDNEFEVGSAVRNKVPFNDNEIAVGSAVRNKVPFNDHEIAVGSAVRNKLPFNDHEIAVGSAVRNKVPANDHEIAGGSAIRNKVPFDDHELPDYSVLKNNEYAQVKALSTEFSIDRVKIIDDKLYCVCGEESIKVYDKNWEYITSINSDHFGNVTGVAESGTGDLIVSCSIKQILKPGGLHQVTLQGSYVTRVTEGKFYDVCVYNGTVYGLTHTEIQQFQLKNSEYVQVGTIDLKTKYSRMCINNEHIFLSSYSYPQGGRIFVYNHATKKTQELADQPNLNWDPSLCSVDSHNNVLVVNYKDHNTVYVYHKDESKWHEVLSAYNCLQKYEDAVVDERGDNIWVTTGWRLIKYTRK